MSERERLFVNFNKRTVITDLNPDWIIGHVEERKDESSDWVRSLHSDWVFARIGDNIGERRDSDPERFDIPTSRTGGLVVGEPGDGLQDIFRWTSNAIGLLDMVGLEAAHDDAYVSTDDEG